MRESIEYQIFIGCNDSQVYEQIVEEQELKEIVASFFARNKVDFTVMNVKGGYLHKNGTFVYEDTMCITILGNPTLDIARLARNLSMFMNQETVLIIRKSLEMGYQSYE